MATPLLVIPTTEQANGTGKCSTKSREVANWTNNEELKILVTKNGYSITGRIFGVSDNVVRKRLKSKL